MAMLPQEWSISGLSVELGMDRRTLAKRLADVAPVREDAKGKLYRMRDVLVAVYETASEGSSYEQERTRLTKAQADKTELEVKVLNGSLIPSHKVEEVWGGMLGSFRARCLSIPTKAAHAVISVADLAEAEAILKDYVHEALSELADYDASQYSTRPSGQSGEDRSAAADDDGQPVGGRAPKAKQRGKRGARTLEH